MDDNYIHFELDNRKLKINKENPDDIFMWKTQNGKYKMKKPRWNQIKIQTKSRGYKELHIVPKKYKLHRVNYFAHNQDWNIHDSSPNNQIDHKKNKGDLPKNQYNNIENLRVVTNQENQWNRNAKGFFWDKSRQKWKVQIKVNNKRIACKYCDTRELAHNTYQELKKIHHTIKDK